MGAYIFLTAAALSLDSFAVGVAYGVRKISFSRGGMFVFMITGLCLSLLSCAAGKAASGLIKGGIAGGVILTVTGMAMLLQQFGLGDIPLLRLISSPEKGDVDKNRKIDTKEAFFMALALSSDSCAACIGGVAGGNILLPLTVFLFQPVFLNTGIASGRKFSPEGSEKICGIAAGLLLVALGLGNIV